MRLEQLNKHEEISFMEDAEANEAILKNTISKEELCRYLSPLKFLEIETWRKEVPYGDKVETSESEHRKWRTPIQILLPTAGFEDDDIFESIEDTVGFKEKTHKKSTNTNKRTFEDVQRQNAQVLRRTNSDATQNRFEVIRPRIREVTSAGDKVYSRSRQGFPAAQPKKSAEERLKGSYTPANEVKTKQDNGLNNTKHPGHIYVNQRLSGSLLTRDAVLTSYFAPGRPVMSSKIKNHKMDSRNPTCVTRPSTQPAPNSTSPNRNGITLATLPITPPKSPKKLSASSSPGFSGDENHKKIEKKSDKSDIKVHVVTSGRPRTAYEDATKIHENSHSRHPAFRGSNKSLNRGWRSWNKRSFENRINCVTQIYQSPVVNKKAVVPGTPIKNNKARLASLEKAVKMAEKPSPGNRSSKMGSQGINHKDINDGQEKGERNNTTQHEYVTRISYSLANGNQITTSRISDEPEFAEGIHETNIQTSTDNQPEKGQTNLSQQTNSSNEEENDEKTKDKLLSKDKNKTITSPWVDETFNSMWAESEGYYVRKPKLNKTVTFSLNQKTNDDPMAPQNVNRPRDSKRSSITAQSRRKIELLPYNNYVSLSNGKGKIPLHPLSGNMKGYQNKKSPYAQIDSKNHWPGGPVGRLSFGNGIRFSPGTVNSVTT